MFRRPAVTLFWLLALFVPGGCGASRGAVIGDATRALDAAAATAAKWSEAKQNAIVDDGIAKKQDPEIIRARVAEYAKTYDAPFREALLAGYEALYVASLDPSPAALVAALAAGKRVLELARSLAHPP